MKTIGLIGGTGWLSTLEYYRYINEMVNRRLGGLNAAECILYSFNYAQIDALNKAGDARGVFHLVLDAARKLEYAGAECLVLCANTLHQFADELVARARMPLVHVAEATAREICARGLSKVGLLGTRMTMEGDFYKNVLLRHGIATLVPAREDREFIHNTILTELLKDIKSGESKTRFLAIIDQLRAEGAEGIILGCTEIPLLVKPADADLPLLDTLRIHCQAAVEFALS